MPTYFGDQTTGGSNDYQGSTDWLIATCPGSGNHIVTELSIFCKGAAGSPAMRLAIYSANGLTKIYESGTIYPTGNWGWQGVTGSNLATLVGGVDYILVISRGGDASNKIAMYYDSGGPPVGYYLYPGYDYSAGFPSTLAGTYGGYNPDIRCGVRQAFQEDVSLTATTTISAAAAANFVNNPIVAGSLALSETDHGSFVNDPLTTILATLSETDHGSFVDDLLTTILASLDETDDKGWFEDVLVNIVSLLGRTDLAAFIDNPCVTGAAILTATDLAAFVDDLLTTILATVEETEEKDWFEDVVVSLVSSLNETDAASFLNDLLVAVNSTITEGDHLEVEHLLVLMAMSLKESDYKPVTGNWHGTVYPSG